MRWIFIFLIFLNLFFYIWQSQQIEENNSINTHNTSHVDENIPTIKLLAEQPNNHEQPQKKVDIPPLQENAHLLDDNPEPLKITSPPQTCLYLGGVTHKEQLTILIPYLTKIDSSINPKEIELINPAKFHIYLIANNKEQRANSLAKLQMAQINSLLISNGNLKDHISLGYFINRKDTLLLQEILQALQLNFQIDELHEAAASYWFKIPSKQQTLLTHKILLKLSQELPTLQQELMLCDLDSL